MKNKNLKIKSEGTLVGVVLFGLFGWFRLFGLFSYTIEDDLKIKSTREDMMDLANENEKNGDRRNTYK